jgi:hypothetical protein
MHTLRTVILSIVLGAAALAASAQTPGQLEDVPVRILSAVTQEFERPLPSRQGAYREALVLRLDVDASDYDSLSPSLEPYLYIGSHELYVFAVSGEKGRVVLTFHDPSWKELKGGEPMVLTTRKGDPVRNPDRYRGAPRFDPKIIVRK